MSGRQAFAGRWCLTCSFEAMGTGQPPLASLTRPLRAAPSPLTVGTGSPECASPASGRGRESVPHTGTLGVRFASGCGLCCCREVIARPAPHPWLLFSLFKETSVWRLQSRPPRVPFLARRSPRPLGSEAPAHVRGGRSAEVPSCALLALVAPAGR